MLMHAALTTSMIILGVEGLTGTRIIAHNIAVAGVFWVVIGARLLFGRRRS